MSTNHQLTAEYWIRLLGGADQANGIRANGTIAEYWIQILSGATPVKQPHTNGAGTAQTGPAKKPAGAPAEIIGRAGYSLYGR